MRTSRVSFEHLFLSAFAFIGMLTVALFVFSAVSGAIMAVLEVQVEQFVRYVFSFIAGLIVGMLAVTVLLAKEGNSQ